MMIEGVDSNVEIVLAYLRGMTIRAGQLGADMLEAGNTKAAGQCSETVQVLSMLEVALHGAPGELERILFDGRTWLGEEVHRVALESATGKKEQRS